MKDRTFTGPLVLFLVTIIWGTSFVVLKSALNGVGVLWILAIRFTLSSLIFLFLFRKKFSLFDKRTLKGGILLGISLFFAYIFQTYGLIDTTPGKNAFLTTSYCIFVPFFAWIIYRRKPSLFNIISALICLTGIGLISLNGYDGSINMGDILTVISGIFYAVLIIILEEYAPTCEVSLLSIVEYSTVAVLSLLSALIFDDFNMNLNANSVLQILYLSLFCTAFCFYFQAWGQQYTNSSLASVIMPFESVFGFIFSYFIYGEELSVKFIIGAFLIVISVIINEIKITQS